MSIFAFSSKIFVLFLFTNFLPAQAFLFPPSASGGCSCPPTQCPAAAPTSHCVGKRQTRDLEEQTGDQVETGKGGGGEGEEEDDENMAMVYDDDDGNGSGAGKGALVKEKGEPTATTIVPVPTTTSSSTTTTITTIITTSSIGINADARGKVPTGRGKGQKEGQKRKLEHKKKPKGGGGGGGESNNSSGAERRPLRSGKNCNSELMRQIMLENINAKPSAAKRQIQSKVSAQIGGRIDVICARKAFSYIFNSELFCEAEKDGTICLCYRQQQS